MALPWYAIRAGALGAGVTGFPGDFVYVWSPSGQLPPWSAYSGSLVIGVASGADPYTSYPTWYLDHAYMSPFVAAFRIPIDATIGTTYHVSWTTPPPFPPASNYLEVTAIKEYWNPYLIPPASSFSDIRDGQSYIQDAINAGYSPIFLSPGDCPIGGRDPLHPAVFDLTGPYVAPVVVIDGQNWASLTAMPALGLFGYDPTHGYMFSVTKPLTLRRLSLIGSDTDFGKAVLGSLVWPDQPQTNVNVSRCKLVDINLGRWYVADEDSDYGDPAQDPYAYGTLVDRCEFVRAATGQIPTATVFQDCLFRETGRRPDVHRFYPAALKWLAVNCDFTRTPRGVVLQNGPIKNGVLAACRFWDIAQGTPPGGGEVIALEAAEGTSADTIYQNSFVWCHAYNCSGSGISMYGAGMHDNLFQYITVDVRAGGIDIQPEGPTTYANHDNKFEHIEMGSWLSVNGHCSHNTFDDIVALRNPLRNGSGVPGIQYLLNVYQGMPPFADGTTFDAEAGESPNIYKNLYLSNPEQPIHVFPFQAISYTYPYSPP